MVPSRMTLVALFMYGFCNAAAYVTSRTVADSSFLSQLGPERLPAMYMICAAALALISAVYMRMAAHRSTRRNVRATLLLFAFISTLLPVTARWWPESLVVPSVIYLFAQARGVLGTIQYATLLNEELKVEQRKRWLGAVGFGATLAGFVMGIVTGVLSEPVSVEQLLYLVALIDLTALLPVHWLRDHSSVPVRSASELLEEERLRDVVHSNDVLVVAALVATCMIAATFVEFQWKVAVADEFLRNKREMARYFGYFYGGIYFVTGMLQLVMLPRVLQRMGVLAALVAFPLSLAACSLTILLASVQRVLLWAATLAKGCDVLKRSMHDPALLMIYGALPVHQQRASIAFVAGFVKPVAEASAALMLMLLVRAVTNRQLSLVILGLLLIWGVFVLVWRRKHADSQAADRRVPTSLDS